MQVITVDADTKKRVYTRKEVADICGVSTQTIRLWEDAGSIPPSIRDDNDYRYWTEDIIDEIKTYANLSIKDRHKK